MRLLLLLMFLVSIVAATEDEAQDRVTIEWTDTSDTTGITFDSEAVPPSAETTNSPSTGAKNLAHIRAKRQTTDPEKKLAEWMRKKAEKLAKSTTEELSTTTVKPYAECLLDDCDNDKTTEMDATTESAKTETDHPCAGRFNLGKDFIILFDRSFFSYRDKFVQLTEGLLDRIEPWTSNNRIALITYATDATVDVEVNSTATREEFVGILKAKTLKGPGDLMNAMRTANEQILDKLPWREHTTREKIVIILMADDSSIGTTGTGVNCSELKQSQADFRECMQKGYAHQRALITAKYGAQIFLVITSAEPFYHTLKYVEPLDEIVHLPGIDNFSLHALDEFNRRFCGGHFPSTEGATA